jgi:hypothetical protein
MLWLRRSALVMVLVTSATAVAQSAKVSSVLDMSDFVRDWQISKQFTIDVANAMPADLYNFKPSPEEMTFGEQMIHIAQANVFRFNQMTGAKTPFALDPSRHPAADKQTALNRLDRSFDYVLGLLPEITPEQLQRPGTFPLGKDATIPMAAR